MTKPEIIKNLKKMGIEVDNKQKKEILYAVYQKAKKGESLEKVEAKTVIPEDSPDRLDGSTSAPIAESPPTPALEDIGLPVGGIVGGTVPEAPKKQTETEKRMAAEIEALKRKDEETQRTLKMLYDVADKGRIFNYENKTRGKKPFKIQLSVLGGKTIIGWRTLKDEKVMHPSTGKQIGEIQQYELILLSSTGEKETITVNGYPAFSEARYGERIHCEVVSRKEDWEGNSKFDVKLPDGRTITIDSRFAN